MRRLTILLALLSLAFAAGPVHAGAAETWRSQQPAGGGAFPLLGEVGDLECWSANRCVLIAGGNGGVGPGIFAYDGNSWYRYATVCGGNEGRVAWAGPTEFWTVSTQQAGQATTTKPPVAVSLCHFKDGQVVASYGEPVGVANSYQQMAAAACSGPSDCWFAGQRLATATSANPGAFHLHWDGTSVTPIPSKTTVAALDDPGRAITDLAYHDGDLFEGVNVQAEDVPNSEEEKAELELALGPSLVHRIEPGAATPFKPLFGAEPFSYGEAQTLQGFLLSGQPGQDLWAVSGSESAGTGVTVLRFGESGLRQLSLTDPGAVLAPEVRVDGLAAEPDSDDAVLAFRLPIESPASLTAPARLTRVRSDGTVDPPLSLPLIGDEIGGEQVGNKGVAGPIECPAVEQCWLATRRGWLFHLGSNPAPNSDPAMHVLVTSRPPDNSLPSLPPLDLPDDDSGAGEEGGSGEEPIPGSEASETKIKPPLISKITQKLLGSTVIEYGFKLRERAKVWVVAFDKGKLVAKTRHQVMSKGRRSIRIKLDPDHWPTKLEIKGKVLSKKKKKGSK